MSGVPGFNTPGLRMAARVVVKLDALAQGARWRLSRKERADIQSARQCIDVLTRELRDGYASFDRSLRDPRANG